MLYRAAKGTVSPVVRALWRPQVEGADNVPRQGESSWRAITCPSSTAW
ncbi:hypothetical protein [Allobranchiibius sp. GilTou73]